MAAKAKPRVSIVMVNWNGRKDTVECIESLRRIDYPNYRIVVSDNGSSDGSQAEIRKRFPRVRLIENGSNVGLAEGSNAGIRDALADGSDFVLLLNNDMTVKRDFLAKLVGAAVAHPGVAMAGAKVMYYWDRKRIWSAGLRKRAFAEPVSRGLNEIDRGQYDEEEFVDSIHACSLLSAKALRKIGPLHSDFFIILEEPEWGLRAVRNGYKVLYVPGSVVYHKVAQSVGKVSRSRPFVVYYTVRNWLVTVRRDYGLARFLVNLLLESLVFSWYRVAKFARAGEWGNIRAYALAVLDAALGRMPKRFVQP